MGLATNLAVYQLWNTMDRAADRRAAEARANDIDTAAMIRENTTRILNARAVNGQLAAMAAELADANAYIDVLKAALAQANARAAAAEQRASIFRSVIEQSVATAH